MSSRLIAVVVDIETHVSSGGWDQPPRMFALAAADEMAATEPGMADALGLDAGFTGWVPIEQEWPEDESPLDEVLANIGWPDEVHGCVLAIERMVLPPDAEAELISEGLDPESFEFTARASSHPRRRDVRMIVGIERSGAQACRLRVQQEDGTETFTDGPDLVPGLSRALAQTFE